VELYSDQIIDPKFGTDKLGNLKELITKFIGTKI